uniref:Uncharacterized protein n=1 Tax=Nelumbo nucifera TaxID=4432 RepID=A0A822ZI17_NELNU|nr:TPA_asm: hypothetical protein HUJ06_003013 [Nelumbo nucifera]
MVGSKSSPLFPATCLTGAIYINSTGGSIQRSNTVLEAYTMTEALHLMDTNSLPEDGAHKPGSVGKLVGQEMAILDGYKSIA